MKPPSLELANVTNAFTHAFSAGATVLPTEFERRFLVRGHPWLSTPEEGGLGPLISMSRITQGYLCLERQRVVRVRLSYPMALKPGKKAGPGQAFLTIKTQIPQSDPPSDGIEGSHEFEYEIPLAHGQQLLAAAHRPWIEKIRRKVGIAFSGLLWEVDEFIADNAGLVVAEIELPVSTSPLPGPLPAWLGEEITGQSRFSNARLVSAPFDTWPDRSSFTTLLINN